MISKNITKITLLKISIFLLLAFLLNSFVVEAYRIEGSSMHPTLEKSDLVLINKFTNNFSIGDIVILKKNGETYIKRICGLPGDRVELRDNVLKVNGEIIKIFSENLPIGVSTANVGDELYYVLGDNILNSVDSRSFGLVREEEILGKVSIIYFPLNRLATLTNFIIGRG